MQVHVEASEFDDLVHVAWVHIPKSPRSGNRIMSFQRTKEQKKEHGTKEKHRFCMIIRTVLHQKSLTVISRGHDMSLRLEPASKVSGSNRGHRLIVSGPEHICGLLLTRPNAWPWRWSRCRCVEREHFVRQKQTKNPTHTKPFKTKRTQCQWMKRCS